MTLESEQPSERPLTVGQKVKIHVKIPGHEHLLNKVGTITSREHNAGEWRYWVSDCALWFRRNQLQLVGARIPIGDLLRQHEDLLKQDQEIKAKITELNEQVEWTKKYSTTGDFDPLEYEIFKTLTSLQNKSLPEAAKDLSQFVRNHLM